MTAPLDVFVLNGQNNYVWLCCAGTDDQAVNLIREKGPGRSGVFFVHSQPTGNRTFYRTESGVGVIQLEEPPRELGLTVR
jgi:hypothetical protein